VSFVVMALLGITEAIAFDRHFAEYGRFALL
jgi:predicted nucleic acid-binding protein